MTALRKTASMCIEDYLAGEERSEIKHEYLGGAVHAMAGGSANHAAISANAIGSLFSQLRGKPCRTFTSDLKVRIDLPSVLIYRRRPEGGFAKEIVEELEAIIELPEIGASLPVADLYDQVKFPSADQPTS